MRSDAAREGNLEPVHPAPAAAAPPERTRWGLVLGAVAAGVTAAFQIGKVPPAVPDLRADLGLSLVMAGWVISTYSALGAVCGTFVGRIADWFGHRLAIPFGLASLAVGSLLGAASGGPVLMLASRVLEGVGLLLVLVSMPTLIIQVTRPPDLGVAFGLWGAFMPLGMSLMMFAAPALLSAVGWRGLWVVNGAAAACAAVLLAGATRTLPTQRRGEFPRVWRDLRTVVTSRGPLLLAGSWGMYVMIFMVVVGFLPTMLMEHGISQSVASAMTAIAVAGNMVGSLVGGWLLKRRWPRWLLISGANAAMGLAAVGIYSPYLSESWRYAFCLFFSTAGGIQPPAVLGGAPVYAPSPRLAATTNGLVFQTSYLTTVLGPPAAALLATASGGWQNTPWFLSTAAAAALLCSLALRGVPAPGEL